MSNVDKLRLSEVTVAPVPTTVPAGHPFKNQASQKKLLTFLMPRAQRGSLIRDARLSRLVEADKQLYGWLRLNQEDAKRKLRRDETGQPYAIQQHMPLALLHLTDVMSYFSGIFAPNNGMFQHVGDAAEQKEGKQILKLMNNHALHAGYYKQLMRSILDIHKYQLGGLITEWTEDAGFEVVRQPGMEAQLTPSIVWAGNRTQAVDLYNSFWQPGINAADVADKSEYFCTVRPTTYYELQRKGLSGEWFRVDEILMDYDDTKKKPLPLRVKGINRFYKNPPQELMLGLDSLSKQDGPWDFLAYGNEMSSGGSGDGFFELLTMWCWVNPYKMNLLAKKAENRVHDRLELWKFEVVNAQYIVSAQSVTNMHGRLPVILASLNYDVLGEYQKSKAEIMKPLQDLLSFMLNTHILGTRNNIWGLTLYNREMVDLSQISEDSVSARVPVKATGADMDLSRAIHKVNSAVDTKQTMSDFQLLLGVINQLIPSQALPSQIAGIDRAVDRQVAAVIQGGNRPMMMAARILDEVLLRPWRTMMFYNIIQYQDDIQDTDENGESITISGESLAKANLQYIIGQGLKALDKQLVAQELRGLIQMILQSAQALEEIDVVELMEAWSNYLDVEIDMTQFRKARPQPQDQPGGLNPGTAVTADKVA